MSHNEPPAPILHGTILLPLLKTSSKVLAGIQMFLFYKIYSEYVNKNIISLQILMFLKLPLIWPFLYLTSAS